MHFCFLSFALGIVTVVLVMTGLIIWLLRRSVEDEGRVWRRLSEMDDVSPPEIPEHRPGDM